MFALPRCLLLTNQSWFALRARLEHGTSESQLCVTAKIGRLMFHCAAATSYESPYAINRKNILENREFLFSDACSSDSDRLMSDGRLMVWKSMPRRLTSMWPDVEVFNLNREPADVDRVSVGRLLIIV
jgi:hypothetical protein